MTTDHTCPDPHDVGLQHDLTMLQRQVITRRHAMRWLGGAAGAATLLGCGGGGGSATGSSTTGTTATSTSTSTSTGGAGLPLMHPLQLLLRVVKSGTIQASTTASAAAVLQPEHHEEF
jgi:hypothetical protein